MRFILFFLILFKITNAIGQTSDYVTRYFTDIRSGRAGDATLVMKEEKPLVILQSTLPYYKDTVSEVRMGAYRLTQLTGIISKEINTRTQAVQYLIQGCADNHDGNTDMVIAYLRQFKKTDFGLAAKDSLRSLFEKKSPPSPDLLKLAGYLEIRELINNIQPLTQPGNSQSTRWAALLALSRMSDVAALEELMIRTKRLRVNDDLVYDIFPDIIYTRQKPAIQYMIEIMRSDSKDCLSADAEREVAIPCGYRIMEQLAPVIQGYPLKLDVSGDIKTKNYAEALGTVRSWFDKHPEFMVVNDTY